MSTFFTLYASTFLKPETTFKRLVGEDRKIYLGLTAVLITAFLYSFVYFFLILGGGLPFKPWLAIPLESYYRYNLLLCAPTMILGWILAAGTVHTATRLVTTNGSFDKILSCFGFGLGISSWTTGIHDFVTSLLGAIQVIDQREYEMALNSPTIWRAFLWIQMAAYLIAFILLFSKSVRVVYKMNVWQSILFGTFGFLIYQLFFLVFNR